LKNSDNLIPKERTCVTRQDCKGLYYEGRLIAIESEDGSLNWLWQNIPQGTLVKTPQGAGNFWSVEAEKVIVEMDCSYLVAFSPTDVEPILDGE